MTTSVIGLPSINREDSPRGSPSNETLSVAPQGELEISPVNGQAPFLFRHNSSSFRVVAGSPKRDERSGPTPKRAQYSNMYKYIKHRLGAHLNQDSAKELWAVVDKKLQKHFRNESSVLSPKAIQR